MSESDEDPESISTSVRPFTFDRVKLKQTIERVVHNQLQKRLDSQGSSCTSSCASVKSGNVKFARNAKSAGSSSSNSASRLNKKTRAKTAPSKTKLQNESHESIPAKSRKNSKVTRTRPNVKNNAFERQPTIEKDTLNPVNNSVDHVETAYRRTSIPARGALLHQLSAESQSNTRSQGTFGTNTLGSLLTDSRNLEDHSFNSITFSFTDFDDEITLKKVRAKWRSLANTLPKFLTLGQSTDHSDPDSSTPDENGKTGKRKLQHQGSKSFEVGDLTVDYKYRPRHSNPDIVLIDADEHAPRNLADENRLTLSDSEIQTVTLVVPERGLTTSSTHDLTEPARTPRAKPKSKQQRKRRGSAKLERYIIPTNITLEEYRNAPKSRWKVRSQHSHRKQSSVDRESPKQKPKPRPRLQNSLSTESKESEESDAESLKKDELPVPAFNQHEIRVYQRLYRDTCLRLNVVISDHFLKNLGQKSLHVKHQQLSHRDVKACTIALKSNPFVQDFSLTGNTFGVQGAKALATLVEKNLTIMKLGLQDNKLGGEGFRILAEALDCNANILNLNLSGNKIQDCEFPNHGIFIRTSQITHLTLSNNDLDTKTGLLLAEALEENVPLQMLDVSWNKIRGDAARAIIEALPANRHLRHLNVSWNGFGRWCVGAFEPTLKLNNCLTHLDLTGNRIDKEDATDIADGLSKNQSLMVLKLGSNPITVEGACDIITALEDSERLSLQTLDLGRQSINFAFMNKLTSIRERSPVFRAIHGPLFKHRAGGCWDTAGGRIGSSADGTGGEENPVPQEFEQCDPMIVLMEFMRLRGLRVVDLFNQLDTDDSNSLTIDEFKEGLMKANVPLTVTMLDRLVGQLDADGNGEVDFGELSLGQKEHKRIVFRQLMNAKDSGIAYEDTDIGQITERLKQLIFNIQPSTSYGDH